MLNFFSRIIFIGIIVAKVMIDKRPKIVEQNSSY